jgi:hypothetical protein
VNKFVSIFPPTAANLQSAYEDIFQRVVESTAIVNPRLVVVLPEYTILDQKSTSISPTKIQKNDAGETKIEWDSISNYVGKKDDKLSLDEEFKVGFNISFSDAILRHVSANSK